MNDVLAWPPAYTLRHSTRARAVRLRICVREGLQIIVPRNFNLKNIAMVLQRHRRWIERTWLRLQPHMLALQSQTLPEQFSLAALNENWQIVYAESESKRIKLEVTQNKQIILHGNVQNKTLVKKTLLRWLRDYAYQHLPIWLSNLSVKAGLPYAKVTVRNATTRWGSCSRKKNISLNFKLLFLPLPLVEHILLHELCHTVHLNHSRNFWDLLKKVNPDCHQLRKQLKQAHQYMPVGLEN